MPENKEEMFGRVIKMMGGENVMVKCEDNIARRGRIRGKLKRRVACAVAAKQVAAIMIPAVSSALYVIDFVMIRYPLYQFLFVVVLRPKSRLAHA